MCARNSIVAKCVLFILVIFLLSVFTSIRIYAGSKIMGKVQGFVFDLDGKPVKDAKVTVLQIEESYKAEMASDENTSNTDASGYYSTYAKLGTTAVKMKFGFGGPKTTSKTKMDKGQMLVHVEAVGYKSFDGIVDAFAQDTGQRSKYSKADYRLFMHKVVLAPENSEENSVTVKSPYFLFHDIEYPTETKYDTNYTIKGKMVLPDEGEIKDYHPQVFLKHVMNNGQLNSRGFCEMKDDGNSPDEKDSDGIWTCNISWTRKIISPGENTFHFWIATAKDFKIIYDAEKTETILYEMETTGWGSGINYGVSSIKETKRLDADESAAREKFMSFVKINFEE